MNNASVRDIHARRTSGTEEAWFSLGEKNEIFDGEGVEKKNKSIGYTHQKEGELVTSLTYGSHFGEIIAGHKHPVINGTVNLHPSNEDLKTRKHQYEAYSIKEQWIIGFDTKAPFDMWRVCYTWDGKLSHHDLGGKQVQVSKIDRAGHGEGRDRDIVLEDTWNLEVLDNGIGDSINDDTPIDTQATIIDLERKLDIAA